MAWAPAIMAGMGALQQGNAEAAAGKYNAEMSWQNAKIARQSALDEAVQQQRENFLRIGEMRATAGASGVTGGSFLDVLADTAAQGELQRQSIIYAGSVRANLLAHGAALSESQASSAQIGGGLRAGGELLRGSYSTFSRSSGNSAGTPLVGNYNAGNT